MNTLLQLVTLCLAITPCFASVACTVDAIHIEGGEVIATKGAFYTVVKPEEVMYDGKIPADLAKLGATFDAFATYTDANKVEHYCGIVGTKYKCCPGVGTCGNETALPKLLTDKGFTKPSGLTIMADGSVYVAQNGVGFMGIKGDKVITELTKFPADMTNEGFGTIDGFTAVGDSAVFVKGNKYYEINTKTNEADVGAVPSTIVDKGYTPIEGMSFSATGVMYVVKGGKVLAVKLGEVIVEKSPLPQTLVENGFTKIDAMASDKDGNFCFTSEGHYMCIKDDAVSVPKAAFPEDLTKNGFTSADGMSFAGKTDTLCLAKGDMYMCSDMEKPAKLTDLKDGATAKDSTFFHKDLDGFTIVADGSLLATKGGYYGIFDTEGKMSQNKTVLPGALKDALCDRATDVITGRVELKGLDTVDEKTKVKAIKKSLAKELGVKEQQITVGKDGTYTVVTNKKNSAAVKKNAAAMKTDPTKLAANVAQASGVDASKVTASVSAEAKQVAKGGGDGTSMAPPTTVQMAAVPSSAQRSGAMNTIFGLMVFVYAAKLF